jgi:hypothetical protein
MEMKMSNPNFVNCPANTWTKVATNVITGQVWRDKTTVKYLHTYRETGDAAPTDRAEGMPIFVQEESDHESISAVSGIDVYIYAIGEDGRVRVDV